MLERRFLNPFAPVQSAQNRMPHRQQDGITYFATFRLADSLPQNLLDQWSHERAIWLKLHPEPWLPETENEYHRRFSGQIEEWLDQGHGDSLLRETGNRQEVEATLMRYENERYVHHSWVIMPNHVHVLVSLAKGELLSRTVQAWKGISSREIGRRSEGRHSCRQDVSLSRPGRQGCRPSVWMKDYFDRMIRDAEHFWRCARYIRNNPIKAHLGNDAFTLYESDHVRDVLDEKACG